MQWTYGYFLWLLFLIPLPWLVLRNRGYIGYSNLRLVKASFNYRLLHKVPLALFSLGFVFLLLALSGPAIPSHHLKRDIRTRDIVVAVDISQSMELPIKGDVPQRQVKIPELDKELPPRPGRQPGYGALSPEVGYGQKGERLLDGAQAAILRFVEYCYSEKTGDRIGILSFDTSPHWHWPLTDDLKQIWRHGLFIDEGAGGGTNFGQLYPGPIDAAAEQFDEMGKADSRVLILVTDGNDQLSYLAFARLIDAIQSRNIHFYVIGVGSELARMGSDVDIIKLAEQVGGAVYRVETAGELSACFESINKMEKTKIEVDSRVVNYEPIFHYFLYAALAAFALWLGSERLIVSL